MNSRIEIYTECGKNGKQYLVVTKQGRLARDDMCEIIRQYELARLQRAADFINCKLTGNKKTEVKP